MGNRKLLIVFMLIVLAGCGGNDRQEEVPAKLEVPQTRNERDQWQRPAALLALMGDIRGKTVADLFAADGYFTFQLIKAGANVIAIDPDPANIAILEQKKKEAGLGDDRLQIRSATAGRPELQPGEADLGLIVHSFAKISDRMNYLIQVRQGLKDPKQLFLVEWQNRPTPVGPPQDQRIPSEQMMEELGMAGFTGVGAMADKMPYQVILMAMDQVEMSEEEMQRLMEGHQVTPM